MTIKDLGTKVGVKGYAPAVLAHGGYCEVALAELSTIPNNELSDLIGRLVIICGLRELKNDCWEELRERVQQLAPIAVVWMIPPQYPLWGDFDALKDDMTRIRLAIDTQYIDASFQVSLSWVHRGNVIYDPLAPEAWQIFDERRKPTSSQFWRIHGWHPERWVRLYSQKQMEHLAKSIIDFRPKFVTLAHSQRHQQWSELEQVLAALSEIRLNGHHLP
jgi:hypothetical protein